MRRKERKSRSRLFIKMDFQTTTTIKEYFLAPQLIIITKLKPNSKCSSSPSSRSMNAGSDARSFLVVVIAQQTSLPIFCQICGPKLEIA
jgi:hypothetical protein